MNRRMKAVAIGAITAIAGIGVGALGAEVASAHANEINGTATCQSNGTFTVSWKVANDWITDEVVTLVSATPASSVSGLPATIAGSPTYGDRDTYNFATVIQSGIPGTATQARLEVSGTWTLDGVTSSDNNVVGLSGDCVPTTPPPVATPVMPAVTIVTTCGVPDTFTAGPTPGVVYTPTSGVLFPGLNPGVVVATPAPGFVFANNATSIPFSLTGSPIEPCDIPVTPVAPVITRTLECGIPDSYVAGPTVGVTYTPASGTLLDGQTVIVVATPQPGYVFPGGPDAQSVPFTVIGTTIEVCTIPVTPVAPVVTTSDVCAVPDSYVAGPTVGVVYTPTSGTLLDGQTITVVATPAPGYVFPGGAPSVSFPLTGGTIETCATVPTTTPPTTPPSTPGTPATTAPPAPTTTTPGPTTTPTTTVGGVSVEPATSAPQVGAPVPPATTTPASPAAPDAPTTGLPETGSSPMMPLLLGALLLAAGIVTLAVFRRRAVK